MPTAALSFQLDEHYQTEAAREKLARGPRQENADDWKPILRTQNGGLRVELLAT